MQISSASTGLNEYKLTKLMTRTVRIYHEHVLAMLSAVLTALPAANSVSSSSIWHASPSTHCTRCDTAVICCYCCCCCRFVAGLQHVFSSWRKPFNPLLGETWQVMRLMETVANLPPTGCGGFNTNTCHDEHIVSDFSRGCVRDLMVCFQHWSL